MSKLLWTPDRQRIAAANLTDYIEWLKPRCGRVFEDYSQLYQWSVENIAEFWKSIWEYAGIKHSHPFGAVLESSEMSHSQWFDGARLNFAENLLKFRDDHTAIIFRTEDGTRGRLTYAELYEQVAACAAGLKAVGVGVGDRVAAIISNIPEAVIGMLATTSIGAIWSSCSPDFGLQAAVNRFSQIEPKVLLAVDGYKYNGKSIDCTDKIDGLVDALPLLQSVVVIPRLNSAQSVRKSIVWSELLENDTEELSFEQLPFDHPVYILYSSGTTGAPKCIVHGAGGTLLQHFKELVLHTDLNRHDVISYFTTCGWMMWNWLVSSLYRGATIFLYDGSPSYPNLNALWDAIDEEEITIFGTSPKFLQACEHVGITPKISHSLSSLKTILSTGSPLPESSFEWVYESVKDDLLLSSISGGTDIVSCFMLGCPIRPVHSGEIQCRGLGMKVETFNGEGRPVKSEVGELVCTAPFPSMPIYFWNDPDGSKYKGAYFEYFPGVWRHGDYVKITENDGIIVYGRSDATLNVAGVRIGTAEIYAPVEAMDEIEDSIVVEQKIDGDSRIVLFVVTASGIALDEQLVSKIKERLRAEQSPRHVPSRILAVKEIPRTISGKKVEMAVANIINGNHIANRDVLANPDSLKQFEELRKSLS